MRVILANGSSVDLGKVEITPTIGITDQSRRVTDDFGVTTVVPRKFSRRMSMRLAVSNARADEVYNQLVALRAKTATFIADDRYAWLQAEGRIKEFEFAYQTGDQTYYTLSIDGIAETEGVTDTGVDPSASGKPSAFKLVQPVSVTDAVLTSSSVAEGDAPAWSAAATFAKGAVVTRAHRVYESLTDGNTGADPTADAAKWLDTGPTNRWAMFDEALGTSTIASAAVEVVLKTVNAISALALLDTNAASVRVRAPSYDRTVVPNGAGQAIFLDLAVAASANITVTVTPAAVNPGPQYWDDGAQWMDAGVWSDSLAAGDGTVTIGTFLFGELKGLGATETGVTAGITDYSRKETDEFGDVTIVERSWSKRMAAKTLIRSDAVDVVADRLASVRARPSLWIARTNTDSLTIYGYPKDWSIEVGLNTSKLSLSVEGLSRAAPARTGGLGGSVDWTDLTDKTGTKPTNNADKTSENTSKDTNAVGGVPAASITGRLATLVEVTIPAVNAAVADADTKIAVARGRADAARTAADQALSNIESQVTRLDDRIDSVSASGGYDDTAVRAEVKRVDEAAIGRDAALGTRVDSVSASITDTDTNLRALVQTKETAAVDRENAISRRVDQIIAEGGGGSEGVDTVARSEISRVEQASVTRDNALGTRVDNVSASIGPAVNAKAQEITTAYVEADQALAGRAASLESAVNGAGGLLARVRSNEDAITNLPSQYAAASKVASLDAQMRGAEPSGISTSLIARIEDRATAIADAKTGVVAQTVQTLRGEYNGTVAEVSDQRGVINGLNGKTAAYVRIMAATPGGRAALSLWSDQYGGAWSLTGDGQIDGNLTVNGTISARAFNRDSVSRYARVDWRGPLTPAAGSRVLVPWSISLPTIAAQGRFIYELIVDLTTNVDQTVTSVHQGKTLYTHFVADGGGLEILCLDPQGNGYRPRPNGSDPVLAAAPFAPLFQASIGNGSLDTGIVNDGDYYYRNVAATYTINRIDLRLTWSAI